MQNKGGISHERLGDAIQRATGDVFSMMLGLESLPGGHEVHKSPSGTRSGVIALVGLTGEWVGSGQVSCEPGLACRIASAMLMAEYESVDDDVLDAIAEVTNMIVGNVKNLIEEDLGPMGMSTPTVVHGYDFETRTPGNPEWVAVQFDCSGEPLTVQVVLAPGRVESGKLEAVRQPKLEALRPDSALPGTHALAA
jgi:chemotaxis protein CheX